jgi:hypothetical protein
MAFWSRGCSSGAAAALWLPYRNHGGQQAVQFLPGLIALRRGRRLVVQLGGQSVPGGHQQGQHLDLKLADYFEDLEQSLTGEVLER